ncbi:MAG: ABC transporter ATP-binding protein/permease, partial [Oceanobacter sp.]
YFADFVAQKNLAVLMPLAIILASASVSWLVPIIFLFTAPLVPLFMILVGSRAAEISRVNLTELNRLGDLLSDRLKNLQALQLAGTTETESDRLFQQSEQYRTSTMRVLRLSFLSGTLLEFFSAISVAIVALYLGLYFLNKYELGAYSSGYGLFEGIFLLMLAPEFYLPLRRMGALYHDRMNAMGVAEHLMKLDQLHRQEQAADNQMAAKPLPELELFQVEQLQSGTTEHPIHNPISFELKPGERLLLNGPSGVGKTSLLDTLAGLRPLAMGGIQLNQTGVSLYQNASWHRQIGYLSQRPELLFASIRDNLSLGKNFSDEELFSALDQAQIAELVQQLPGGLDYQISDDGGYLSGGQAQRIALARVFLHRPKLLLLDEPTANLDVGTANSFMEKLAAYTAEGNMLIMASHRPAQAGFFTQEIQLTSVREAAQ